MVSMSGAATGADLIETGIPRWNANVDALRTLKRIEAEGRPATVEERRILEGYSGFGGSEFGPAFDLNTDSRAWNRRGTELRELTTEDEYDSITASRLNAFYTTPEVIRNMWGGVERLGADRADTLRVLEPSAGTGRFLEYQPGALARKSERTAVELDDLSARILRAKFPDDTVYHTGFEKAPLPDDHYDLAISNVPFGSYGVTDPQHDDYVTKRIHNYFFAKALDKVRPGGVVAFITTGPRRRCGRPWRRTGSPPRRCCSRPRCCASPWRPRPPCGSGPSPAAAW